MFNSYRNLQLIYNENRENGLYMSEKLIWYCLTRVFVLHFYVVIFTFLAHDFPRFFSNLRNGKQKSNEKCLVWFIIVTILHLAIPNIVIRGLVKEFKNNKNVSVRVLFTTSKVIWYQV